MEFFPALKNYFQQLESQQHLIPEERKAQLQKLSKYILDKTDADSPINLNFICTHNSRRSHISQIWAAASAAFYELNNIKTFSGGTEATAFNPRAVAAMERAGFQINNPGGDNPAYEVSFTLEGSPVICFSKVFDDAFNPSENFAAIMTCSHADENCPFIPGASMRLPITYEDPKLADGTSEESQRYDERVEQIGREMAYAFRYVSEQIVDTSNKI